MYNLIIENKSSINTRNIAENNNVFAFIADICHKVHTEYTLANHLIRCEVILLVIHAGCKILLWLYHIIFINLGGAWMSRLQIHIIFVFSLCFWWERCKNIICGKLCALSVVKRGTLSYVLWLWLPAIIAFGLCSIDRLLILELVLPPAHSSVI